MNTEPLSLDFRPLAPSLKDQFHAAGSPLARHRLCPRWQQLVESINELLHDGLLTEREKDNARARLLRLIQRYDSSEKPS